MRQKLFAFLLAFSLVLSGCSQVASSSSSSGNSNVSRTVTGKVKTVSGNELELAIGTLNSPRPGGQEESSDSASQSSGRGSRPDSASGSNGGPNAPTGEMPSGGMGGGPMGEAPSGEGGFPGGAAGGGFPGTGGQSGQSSGSSITLTGEMETISIPVGTPVTMAGSTTTLDFSQIMVKNVITITYETGADGTEYLASITILS